MPRIFAAVEKVGVVYGLPGHTRSKAKGGGSASPRSCVGTLRPAWRQQLSEPAIRDYKGNEISGDDLLARYLGVMRFTADLRAVDIPCSDSE
jgi:hypothetical protein